MPSNSYEEQPAALQLEARKKIFDVVRKNAGCHLREIQRVAGLSFGSASYHLSYLKKHNLINEETDGKNIRYFPLDFPVKNEKLLMLLRQRSVRTILLFIFGNEGGTHQQITSSVKLSPSTVTWHLKKLLDTGIIRSGKQGRYKRYFLCIPKGEIMDLLISYKESFFDSLVDGIIELWERS